MNERIVKLTLDEFGVRWRIRQDFIISIGENGAEIRRASAPVVDRDASVAVCVGVEPHICDFVLRVEEQA